MIKLIPKNNRISRKIPLEKEANKFWKIKEYLQLLKRLM